MEGYDDIITLFRQYYEFTTSVYAGYKSRTDDILSGKEPDIYNIERFLDSLMDFCFDYRFVCLYKSICRYLLPKLPRLVCKHILLFKKLYGDDIMETVTIEFELDSEFYEKAKEILESLGMTVEEACVLFIKEVVARKALPFSLSEADLDEFRNKRKDSEIQ